ncbi:MAG: hypothetical protein P8P66_13440 [Paracoccaceae bacterium]|nr:hypothetical protein [Paracoccaceae bacterium]
MALNETRMRRKGGSPAHVLSSDGGGLTRNTKMKPSKKLNLCRDFLAKNDQDLQNAVLLLCGSGAVMRLQRLRAAVAKADGFMSSHRRELNWLKSMLGFDLIGDDACDDFCFHAEVSPEDPAVPSLCLLFEAVEQLLADIDAVAPSGAQIKLETAA